MLGICVKTEIAKRIGILEMISKIMLTVHGFD
jgi:hypothetical protein